MKLKIFKSLSIAVISLFANNSYATETNYSRFFSGVDACFIFYDKQEQKELVTHNSAQCEEFLSTTDTFQIPLALMGFEESVLETAEKPVIDYRKGYPDWVEIWKRPHNPTSWMQESVLWYSQLIASQLGMPKIQEYLAKFDYGNQDMSGTPGQDDGLTKAWFSSSLKITGKQQLEFLDKLSSHKLPVGVYSMLETKKLLYEDTFPSGWSIYAKAGSGFLQDEKGNLDQDKQLGWYIGWIGKGDEKYIFVINIKDKQKFDKSAGWRAQQIMKNILDDMGMVNKKE
jgi:beta-lactamase class D